MEPAPRPPSKPSRRRRFFWAALVAVPLVWGGWRAAVRRADLPRLILFQPLPPLPPPLEPDGSPTVGAVALSPDGQTVWSGGSLPFVKSGKRLLLSPAVLPICAWDARTGKLRYTLPGHAREVQALACSPDGRLLVSSGWDNTVKVWDTQTRQLVWSRPGGTPTLVFSPDSRLLAVGGELWDVGTGKSVRAFKGKAFDRAHGFIDPLAGVAFSPDGQTFATVSGDLAWVKATPAEAAATGTDVHIHGHRVYLWDVATGRRRTTFSYDQTPAVTFSPDGRFLASLYNPGQFMGGTDGGGIRVIDAATGAEKWHWERRNDPDWFLTCLAYSPDGKWLAVGTMSHDVALIDAATGRLIKRLHAYEKPHPGSFQMSHSALAFSQDGKTLVGRGDNTVQVWDTGGLH